jgi:hypothetical protein
MPRSRLTTVQILKYTMAPEGEEESRVINPFINPLEFWRRYLINFIRANRVYYENAIRINEYWFKALWEPWLRRASAEPRKD